MSPAINLDQLFAVVTGAGWNGRIISAEAMMTRARVLAAVMLLSTSGSLDAQGLGAESQAWAEELAFQMLQEHDCEVAFITQLKQFENSDPFAPETPPMLATVHCVDGRSFDIRGPDQLGHFDAAPCGGPNTGDLAC